MKLEACKQNQICKAKEVSSDLLDRIEMLEEFEWRGRLATSLGTLQRGPAKLIWHARDQPLRLLKQEQGEPGVAAPVSPEDAMLRSLRAAFPAAGAERQPSGADL